MATLRHHPQDLRISILTQTDRTHRTASNTHSSPAVLQSRVRVDHVLVEPHDGALVIILLLRHKNHPWQNNTLGSRIGPRWVHVRIRVRIQIGVAVTVAAAEVERENESGSKDEEGEGDGNGVAKARVDEEGHGDKREAKENEEEEE